MAVPSLMALRIRAYRQAAGWSQSALANRCGIARSTLGAVECGAKRAFGVDCLLRVATALNVSVDSLIRPDVPGRASAED